MADIREVARLAGVSVATVSRVVNGMVCVKPETKEKVLEAIERLNYTPNMQGRHLRKSRTKCAAVFIDKSPGANCFRVIEGIEECAREGGYTVIICVTGGGGEARGFDLLFNGTADGAILLSSMLNRGEIHKLAGRFPVISCFEPAYADGLCYVGIDYNKACRDAAEYLIKTPRRRIALLNPENTSESARARVQGYSEALEASGISYDGTLVFSEGCSFKAGIIAAKKMLLGFTRPDAVIACSDNAATGAIKQLSTLGISVPGDVSVIGFGDSEAAEMFTPSLTTISLPLFDMGYNAMDLLIRRLNGRQTRKNLILPHSLIIRQSA
jgi:DNA-binding LacI/PurR family transcriptional regulator